MTSMSHFFVSRKRADLARFSRFVFGFESGGFFVEGFLADVAIAPHVHSNLADDSSAKNHLEKLVDYTKPPRYTSEYTTGV